MIILSAHSAEPTAPEGARAPANVEGYPQVTMRELQKRLEWERLKDGARPRRAARRS